MLCSCYFTKPHREIKFLFSEKIMFDIWAVNYIIGIEKLICFIPETASGKRDGGKYYLFQRKFAPGFFFGSPSLL